MGLGKPALTHNTYMPPKILYPFKANWQGVRPNGHNNFLKQGCIGNIIPQSKNIVHIATVPSSGLLGLFPLLRNLIHISFEILYFSFKASRSSSPRIDSILSISYSMGLSPNNKFRSWFHSSFFLHSPPIAITRFFILLDRGITNLIYVKPKQVNLFKYRSFSILSESTCVLLSTISTLDSLSSSSLKA